MGKSDPAENCWGQGRDRNGMGEGGREEREGGGKAALQKTAGDRGGMGDGGGRRKKRRKRGRGGREGEAEGTGPLELVHAIAVVFVVILAEELDGAVEMLEGEAGMMDAVEHGGLDGGIVDHVLEDDLFTDLKGMVEAPRTHVVAAEAAVASKTVDIDVGWGWGVVLEGLGTTDAGPVGHLETIGHVAGEADIEDGGLDAFVADDVDDTRHEGTGLPGEGAAGFEDDTKVGVALTQGLYLGNEEVDVVVLACHEVAATQVEPLEAVEPGSELLFDMDEGVAQVLGTTLTMAMAMEAVDVGGKVDREVGTEDAETTTGGTRIVEGGLDGAMLGVDTDADADWFLGMQGIVLRYPTPETLVLRERIEGDMAAAGEKDGKVALGIGRRIGMGGRTELLEGQACLVG